MAMRAIGRWRTAFLQQESVSRLSQRRNRVFSYPYCEDASLNKGVHTEEKLENPETLSDEKTANLVDDAARSQNIKDKQYEGSIRVGSPYVRFVIGRGGVTVKRIEKETNAHIIFPPSKDIRSNAKLIVKGDSQESIDRALAQIKRVLQRAERNPNLQYTHFISLPLASDDDLLEQLRNFRVSVLNEEQRAANYVSWFPETSAEENSDGNGLSRSEKGSKPKQSHVLDPDLEKYFSDDESSDDENENLGKPHRRITESLFIKPETLHITLFMLKLFTDESTKVAAELLQGVQSKVLEVLDGLVPKVHLKGVECFLGTPAEARVLAMKVMELDNNKRLQQACSIVKDAFSYAGLLSAQELKQQLTLHATLMNTAFSRRVSNRPFDARKILAKYHLQDWGEHTVNEIHLSQRFFFDPNGYYRCCGSFSLLPSDSQAVASQ
ncbi:hypothetical protein KP509_13G005900 [Ceratopteris richardii]|uniref:K Homology domain-containing protein n=1 Tax=Ceratopteris richardii TaxID=49495 RepID=A0A8T2TEY3_CERRI|nr:hypothetical protein KP509_13G005900 [Ceratopteris richardii]